MLIIDYVKEVSIEKRSQFGAAAFLLDDGTITICYEVLKAEMKDATKLALFRSFDEVLSLDLTMGELEEEGAVDQELETLILQKIEERKAAKKEKNFAKADEIRAELLEMGIVLEDTREGVKWKKI